MESGGVRQHLSALFTQTWSGLLEDSVRSGMRARCQTLSVTNVLDFLEHLLSGTPGTYSVVLKRCRVQTETLSSHIDSLLHRRHCFNLSGVNLTITQR